MYFIQGEEQIRLTEQSERGIIWTPQTSTATEKGWQARIQGKSKMRKIQADV